MAVVGGIAALELVYKMKNVVLSLAVLAMGATAAVAESAVADADNDGFFSLEEIVAVYPNLTAEGYAAIDTNADGKVDAAELAAADKSVALK